MQTKDLMVTFKSRLEGMLPYPGLFRPEIIPEVSPNTCCCFFKTNFKIVQDSI